MKQLIFLLFIGFSHWVISQEYNPGFGEISNSEREMKYYPKDPKAPAVILFDIGKSVFVDNIIDGGYDIEFTRHKRIKIFDKSAFNYAEVNIPYYVEDNSKTEKIISIEAVTFNFENGVMTRKSLSPSAIYIEKVNSRWKNKKFIFPDVQEGSILEFKYVLKSPFHFNLPDWKFQDKIPTIYSEYEVSMIPFYEYVFLSQGVEKFDYQNSKIESKKRQWGNVSKSLGRNVGTGVEFQDYTHTYVMKGIPAFIDESYITSINDYIMKIDFQLSKLHFPTGGEVSIISTWEELNKELLKDDKFGGYLKDCSRFAKKIIDDDIDFSGKDIQEKSKVIIDYIKNNYKWNGFYGKYASQSAKDFLRIKTGNSADINLLMVALLQKADINAIPLILSTRDHGKIKMYYPFDFYTNYVISYINEDGGYLADGTEELLPFNRIPLRCLNEKGIIVEKKGEVVWENLDTEIISKTINDINISIDSEELLANYLVEIKSYEYDAYLGRKQYKDNVNSIKEDYEKKLGLINNISTNGYDDLDSPYSMSFEGTNEIETIGNYLVINPFLNLAITENKLTQVRRSYPVDFTYINEDDFYIRIKIPENYKVGKLPDNYDVDNDLIKISLVYNLKGDEVLINGSYLFKKSIYGSNNYTKIKNYINIIIEKFNEQIIIEHE